MLPPLVAFSLIALIVVLLEFRGFVTGGFRVFDRGDSLKFSKIDACKKIS